MKLLSLFLITASFLSAFYLYGRVATEKQQVANLDHMKLYAEWKGKYGKLYSSPAENNFRLKVFIGEKLYIDQKNAEYEKAYLASTNQSIEHPILELNKFADLTKEEFTSLYAGDRSPTTNQEVINPSTIPQSQPKIRKGLDSSLPLSTSTSYKPKVRSQGTCGSCWAFAAVTAVEKMYYDIHNTQIELSVQELVDCDQANRGCNGGISEKSFGYIGEYGLALESEYPYTAKQGRCMAREKTRVAIPTVQNEMQGFSGGLAEEYNRRGYHAVLSVYCSGMFRYMGKKVDLYDPGLVDECNFTKDHAVNLIGYDSGIVTILNPWGETWGINGTLRIKPCGYNNLWGKGGRIGHPYSNN